MVHILKNSKPETKPNISLQQLAAVKKKLQQDSFVTVVPARKGKAVVVMDMVEYIELNGGLRNDMINQAGLCNIAARSRLSKTPIEDRILI